MAVVDKNDTPEFLGRIIDILQDQLKDLMKAWGDYKR